MYNDRKQKIPTYGGLGYYTVILRVVYKSETKNSPIRCYRMIQSLKTIKGNGDHSAQYPPMSYK